MIRLRVVFGPNPPDAFSNCAKFPTLNPNINCLYPGFTAEVVSMLVKTANFYLEPVVVYANVGEVNWGAYVRANLITLKI